MSTIPDFNSITHTFTCPHCQKKTIVSLIEILKSILETLVKNFEKKPSSLIQTIKFGAYGAIATGIHAGITQTDIKTGIVTGAIAGIALKLFFG